MVINVFPDVTPRGGPNTRVTFVNLNFTVVNKNFFNTSNRSPESRFGGVIRGEPETGVRVIFRFDDA